MKRILALMLSAVMVCGSLVGCGKTETPTPAEAQGTVATEETVSLNIGYMPNYGSLWSVVTAIEKGYFAEENLDVTLTMFQDGPSIIAAMENGSVNFGYIGQGAHKLCIRGRAEIITLSHIASDSDTVIGGPNVKTLEDLKGKVVGYTSGTSSEDILKKSLAKANLTMDDITAMDMDASAVVSAMLSGSLDACATWSPNNQVILDQGKDMSKLSNNLTFVDTSVSLASWIAMPGYLDENEEVAVRFLRALFKGMDYAANGNYEEVAQYVADTCALNYDSVYGERNVAKWFTSQDIADSLNDGSILGYYELQQQNMLDSGAIEAGDVCPVENYVNFDLMTKALG